LVEDFFWNFVCAVDLGRARLHDVIDERAHGITNLTDVFW
jgi:hypothetical protein